MNNPYARAYTEVLEILSHFSEEEYEKIPKEKIDFYEKNKDKNYKFNINPNVELSEQNISKEANAILVLLFRDYFATDKQKEILKKLLSQNQKKIEKDISQKYNPDNIFKSKNKASHNENKDNLENANNKNLPIKIGKDNIFKKIFGFIKRLLYR